MNGVATGKIALTNLVLIVVLLGLGVFLLETDQHDTGLALVNVAVGIVVGNGATATVAAVTSAPADPVAPPKP